MSTIVINYTDEEIVQKWYPVLEKHEVPDDERIVVARIAEAMTKVKSVPLSENSKAAIDAVAAFVAKVSV